MSTYLKGLEDAARLVELEYAPNKEQHDRLKQIAGHIRDLAKRAPLSHVAAPDFLLCVGCDTQIKCAAARRCIYPRTASGAAPSSIGAPTPALGVLLTFLDGKFDADDTMPRSIAQQAAADIRALLSPSAIATPAWIPRAERMPAAGEYVLLTNGEWISTGYCAGRYFSIDIAHESDPGLTPTHWMPLPAAPSVATDGGAA